MKLDDKTELTYEIMKAYAEDKYGETFEVVSFVKAKDYTYTDILTLAKGENFIFNVFHSPEDKTFEKIEDDYVQELIDEKFRERVIEDNKLVGSEINIYASFKYDSRLTKEIVEKSSVDELMEEFSLFHIICVIKMNGEDSSCSLSEAFTLYKNVLEFGAPKLDFEVVCVDGKEDEKLSKCISNIKVSYENDWAIYPSVMGYISVTDLCDLEEGDFLALYKEVK